MTDQPTSAPPVADQLDADQLHRLTKAIALLNEMTAATGVDVIGYVAPQVGIDGTAIRLGSTGTGHQLRYHVDLRQM